MTYEEVVREPFVQWNSAIEECDLLRRQGNFERLDVGVEMLNLASANDGEDIWSFLHEVGNSD